MPWITVTSTTDLTPTEAGQAADSVRTGAAHALGLPSDGVIVILSRALAATGEGAIATIVGGARPPAAEARLAQAVRQALSRSLDLTEDLVAVIRLGTSLDPVGPDLRLT